MDRLAAGSARFANAFSNFPVCSPARSILLSGRYARCNGVFTNQDEESKSGRPTNTTPTLAEVLTHAGYDTALVGKWHLRPTPKGLGFSESLRCRMRHRYYKQTFYRNDGEPYVCEEYSPHHETKAAVQYIREHRDKPFFLYLAWGPPHMPLAEQPERYRTMYKPSDVLLRENVFQDGRMAFDERWFKIYLWDFQYYEHTDTFTQSLPAGMNLRDLTALYYGQITAIDDCVGQVLDAIKQVGIERDTIVLLTSDHGDLLGSHQLFNKGRHYDESTRVPLLVRFPRQLRPQVVKEQIASLVDLMPTVLGLCGLPAPADVQGTSLLPVLSGERQTVGDNAAFIESFSEDGIRTPHYLYSIERKGPHREHLFDCQADPYQMRDLAAESAQVSTLQELRSRVADWKSRTPPAPTAPATRP
jgi:arylsulfatase A-like enzyme